MRNADCSGVVHFGKIPSIAFENCHVEKYQILLWFHIWIIVKMEYVSVTTTEKIFENISMKVCKKNQHRNTLEKI